MNNKPSAEREQIFENSILEAVFRQAVIEDFEEEIAGLLAAGLPPVVVSERHRRRMKALFTRRSRRSVKRTVVFTLRWVSVAIIALILAGCAALAVPAIRRAIIERFIQFYENSMVFQGGKSLQTMPYWEPYYIPGGFSETFRKPSLGTDRNALAYAPAENEEVRIVYTRAHMDGRPAETIVFSYVPCDKPVEGDIIYHPNENSVTWDAEGLSFSVTAGASELPPDLLIEELLKIAQSTEKREVFIQPPLGFWQPTFIPREYTETRRNEAGEYKLTIIEYIGVNGDSIKISVSPADDTVTASLKNSDYSAFESGSIIYHSIVDDNLAMPQNSLLWELKGYYFVINSELSNDEMIKIAQSMRQYEPKNRFPYAPEDLPNGFIELHRNAETFPDDSERSYEKETLEQAYQHCFGQALANYNIKQKRADRKIDDYYTHLFGNARKDTVAISSNKEKSFYEIAVGIGDRKTCPVGSTDGELAAKILDEYAKGFSERNPNFYVFNSVMHLDEQTPHLHIDYVPIANGYKNGMETRNSISVALQQMGFGKDKDSINKWRKAERQILREICEKYGMEIAEETQGRGKTFTPDEYKKIRDEVKEELRAAPEVLEEIKDDIKVDLEEEVRHEIRHLFTEVDKYEQELENLRHAVSLEQDNLKAEKEKVKAERQQFKDMQTKFKPRKDDLDKIQKLKREANPGLLKKITITKEEWVFIISIAEQHAKISDTTLAALEKHEALTATLKRCQSLEPVVNNV